MFVLDSEGNIREAVDEDEVSPLCATCGHICYTHMLDPGDGLTGPCLEHGCDCAEFVEKGGAL